MKSYLIAVLLVISLITPALSAPLVEPVQVPTLETASQVLPVLADLPILVADEDSGLSLSVIIQLVLAILVVVDIIVRLTPTKKDDEIVRKIKALLKHLNIDPDNPSKK